MKSIKTIIVLTVLLFSFNGCVYKAWIGYKKPTAEDFIVINSHSNCMRLAVQNLTPREAAAIKVAANDVCAIFNTEEFRIKVISKRWLLSCDQSNGNPAEIEGAKLYELIKTKIGDYSIHSRKPWQAIAQTDRSNDYLLSRVAIMPERIEAWYSTNDTVRAELVNTIAHETMHIISSDIADRGHGTVECADDKLVSYSIGDIVENIWLSRNFKNN